MPISDARQRASIQVVVPCYNEQHRLPMDAFIDYARSHPHVGFVFVDDGSIDETGRVLAGMADRLPDQIDVLTLARNSGKAEAVRRGICLALSKQPDVVGYWDADLATPLSAVDKMHGLMESRDAEMVMGSRVKLMGHVIERRAARHYMGRVYATCASLVLGMPIYDTQCGAKLFKVSDRLVLVFAMPFKADWTFDVEMLARFRILTGDRWLAWAQQGIVEMPLPEWVDRDGSKVGLRAVVRAPVELARIAAALHHPRFSRQYRRRLLGGGCASGSAGAD